MKSQTFNLLKKEIILGNTARTIIWTVCCLGMFFIPNYPLYIGPFYITLCMMMSFAMNQSAHDILYTVLLPVKKLDVVKARFLYCAMLELIAFLSALIGLAFRMLLNMTENNAGITLTLCYFGFQMLLFAIFNFIYLGNVYKDPIKSGLRFLLASIGYFLGFMAAEFPVWTYYGIKDSMDSAKNTVHGAIAEAGRLFTSTSTKDIIPQLAILFCGILIYAASWAVSFRRASRQFEKYDL